MRKRLMFLLMRSCQTVIHPTDAGRIKHHVKHDVHEILSLALLFFVIYTYTNTQRAIGCVSNLSYVSKITSFGQWCNITRTDTVSGLCFLVCELSSQGFCCFASDVLKIQTIFRYTPKCNYHVLTIDPHTQQLNLTETIIIIPTECHDLIMTSINKIPAENILMLKKLQRKQNIVSTVPNVKCVNC